ncbi:hypothetical protein DSH85_13525 [Enterococcus faecium]|uniref:Uncharacterized protein n=1 Tax=Enterococcus faecium TaxID=1352 RepID=A0A7V7GJZ5_ENTFC|nr:hypothetical protein [Enterococcus faecium]EGP5512521.1 hypothetical protein [Enterococcus faecium]EGP5661824.1 hypothetical protein [Enterococcus faecium]KAA0685932.1 hypothetical protein DTX73_14510 [Enterococcus faecium]KNB95650.1 hypothetical protein LK34_02765 [Enterococcus faecium]
MNFGDFQSLFEYKNIDIKNTLRSLRFVEKNGKKQNQVEYHMYLVQEETIFISQFITRLCLLETTKI